MRRLICIVTLCFLIATMFSGCGILEKLGFGKDNKNLTPTSSIAMGEQEARELSDKVPVHLYFADADNEKLILEVRYIPITEAAKSVSNLASIIVQELAKGPTEAGLQPTIPTGTKLLLPVSINSGVATVNLSKEFMTNHPGGKAAEQMTIYSVVDSLTELKDVSKVSFLIEGKAQKDLKGSFAFDMPFPRSVALISNDVVLVDQVSKSEDKKDKSKKSGKDSDKDSDKTNDKTKPAKSPEAGKASGKDKGSQTTEKGSGTTNPSPSATSGQSATPAPTDNAAATGAQQGVPSSGSLVDDVTGEVFE